MRRVALLVLLAAACDSKLEARVGGALLPQALGVVPLAKGPTIVVRPGALPDHLPAGPVNLAVDHAVRWADVEAVLDKADAAGAQPMFVVGQRRYLRGFVLSERLELGQALKVRALAVGKFCVSPPGTDQAYCLQSADKRHISALFARGVMRKAVETYGIAQARITADPDLAWGDLVRAIDGTRTCCEPMRVLVVR